MKIAPADFPPGLSVSKSLTESAANGGKKSESISGRDLCLDENTSQAASVEFVPRWGTNDTHSRLQNLSESPQGDFRQP